MVGRLTRVRLALRAPGLAQALLLVLGLRAALGLIGWASIALIPITSVGGDHLELLTSDHSRLFPWIGPWERYDALWYEHLALSGYGRYDPGDAFLPLFPGVVHLLMPVFGGNPAVTALVIDTVALAAALAVLHRLVSGDLPAQVADRTLLYLVLSPVALFLFAGFTEAPFLLLAAGALLAARRGRFGAGCVLATLGALCRPTGALLAAPLAVELVADARRRRAQGLRPLRWVHPLVLLPVAALVGWDLWIQLRMGVPGGLLSLQREFWDTRPVAPWRALHDSLHTVLAGGHPEEALNLVSSIALLMALPLMVGRLPGSYVVYALVSAIPIVCREVAGYLQGGQRHVLPAPSSACSVPLRPAQRRVWVDRLWLVRPSRSCSAPCSSPSPTSSSWADSAPGTPGGVVPYWARWMRSRPLSTSAASTASSTG